MGIPILRVHDTQLHDREGIFGFGMELLFQISEENFVDSSARKFSFGNINECLVTVYEAGSSMEIRRCRIICGR